MSNLGGKSYAPGSGISTYDPPGHTNSTVRKNYSETEKAGLVDGVSALSKFDSEKHGPMYANAVDPISGNFSGRPEPYSSERVSEKGNSFDIC